MGSQFILFVVKSNCWSLLFVKCTTLNTRRHLSPVNETETTSHWVGMEVFFSLRISKYVFPLLQCTVDTTTESLFLSGSELPEGIESSDSRIPQLSCDHTSQSFLTTLLKSPLSLSFFFLVHLSIPAFLSHSSALSLSLPPSLSLVLRGCTAGVDLLWSQSSTL